MSSSLRIFFIFPSIFYIKVQHQNPFCFHILENLAIISFQDFNKFCKLEMQNVQSNYKVCDKF